MARKSLIQKTKKRALLQARFKKKRQSLKRFQTLNEALRFNKIPRNSSITRLNRRCIVTRRNRSVVSFFRLSRHALRNFAKEGLLPRVTKSSW